ncbi:ABC transporter ATP-binding protein [Helcobacillus massiliensis]|uniref:Fatty acid ABC transporter ATP-binding/permease protein n=1 Tax=Helcobacillus massiliensis TaxID=521392 RepID=A0A839QTZ3_9MICO|nr:ABC transporter ATP-binding protein [Helcobacillus massiliensis]MBB3023933.1 ATP-binding cassette subfamily B protein [Helcobacillus massiliensis]MBB3024098.1 ATP-binding cassette subfamily B protein [Helcobacillus massiliensis]
MKPLLRILSFTRRLWPFYLAILLTSTLATVATLLVPFLVGHATDIVAASAANGGPADGAMSSIIWTAVWILVALTAQALLHNIGGWYGDVMANRMRTILSVRYYEKLLHLPQSWYDSELTGTIVARLNRSITEISQFAKTMSNMFATMLLTTVAVLVISGWYAWPLAVLLAIVFPVYVWLTALTSTKWQKLEGQKNEQIDIASGRFSEVVGQIRVVKSFVREKGELNAFTRRFITTDATTREQSKHWHTMDILRRTALNVVFFAIYVIIFVNTVQGAFTVGEMVLLIQMMMMARQPVESMSYLIDMAQRAIAGSRDYFRVMDTPIDARSPMRTLQQSRDSAIAPVAGAPTVEFDSVHFAYDEGVDVLQDISFSIHHGEKVAFVGESGGGKSTIVNLLLGLYQARSGRISVAGHDVADLQVQDLRARVGVVFQDASLFSGTIRENIAYGRPDATDDEIRAAARKANAERFIEKFADGYDTVVGERGLKLSGGQKQRIAVARAILKDAPILVLDEATSALDTKSEREVQRGLDELMADRTSLIIAHRLSTIANVDRIVTLKDGQIDEIGTPAELARSGGIYAELLAMQNAGARKQLERFGITG